MTDSIKELINNVLEAEQTMIDLYVGILKEISDESIAGPIRSILKDEGKHASNAKEMLKILEE